MSAKPGGFLPPTMFRAFRLFHGSSPASQKHAEHWIRPVIRSSSLIPSIRLIRGFFLFEQHTWMSSPLFVFTGFHIRTSTDSPGADASGSPGEPWGVEISLAPSVSMSPCVCVRKVGGSSVSGCRLPATSETSSRTSFFSFTSVPFSFPRNKQNGESVSTSKK